MLLPPELRSAISHQLEGVSRNLLSERSSQISSHYRSGGQSTHAMNDELDALAYAVVRMPATYSAVRNVLSRLQERCPAFSPASLVDFGAGPGTASWAASDGWPNIAAITQLDANMLLLQLGQKLKESASSTALRNSRTIRTDLSAPQPILPATDLAIISYTLAEMSTAEIRALLTSAWSQCRGALVIVEPGTPGGWERILLGRDLLLSHGAKILAPCPHQLPCPLVAPDWCHFVQRVQRSRDHMLLKSADVPWEDEKFSYLIAVCEHLFYSAQRDRILAQPEKSKNEIRIKLCRTNGQAEFVQVRKRDLAAFKALKKKDWGDEAGSIAPEQSR
ncbi:MAG: rRNA methyltransferase [Acidobacteria bacterium]|nr:rRNA methyltransferase [Acidobacteriota bacterium]